MLAKSIFGTGPRAVLFFFRVFSSTWDGAPLLRTYAKLVGDADFAEVPVRADATVAELKVAVIAALGIAASPRHVTLALSRKNRGRPGAGADAAPSPPLDCALSVGNVFRRLSSAKLVATVHSPPPPTLAAADALAEPVLIPYRRAAGERPDDPDPEPQPVASPEAFARFLAGKTMWAARAAPGGGETRGCEVLDLESARRALAAPGTHLVVRDRSEALDRDVDELKRHRHNMAVAFEELSNKAAALDWRLRERYGVLMPCNGGRGVVFKDARTGRDFVSVDGLFLADGGGVNSGAGSGSSGRGGSGNGGGGGGVAVVNEAKLNLRTNDVAKVLMAIAKLRIVQAAPAGSFSSAPEGLVLALGARRLVALASSTNCAPETAADCRALRVHLQLRDGAGFRSVLANEEPLDL